MTSKHCPLVFISVLVIALLYTTSALVLAEEASAESSFPEGTIEVPQGTEIHIDDTNNIVTIVDSPADIASGDTFVVYLQDLPIGYVAESVTVEFPCSPCFIEGSGVSVA